MIALITGIALAIAAALGLTGDDNLAILMENPDGTVGSIVVSTQGGTQTLTVARTGVVFSANEPPEAPRQFQDDEIRALFGSVIAAQPEPPSSYVLFFETGQNQITPESQRVLDQAIADIQRRVQPEVSVIGHTDTMDGSEANFQLGFVRATEVSSFLLGRGVLPGIIEVRSHGEGDLAIPTPDNVSEPRNRRVEVFVR